MSVWALNAILIEAMAAVGALGVGITRRTSPAFAAGFNTMIVVAGVYVLSAPPLNARRIAILVMVILYLIHMNGLLVLGRRYTALGKLDAKLSLSQKYALSFVLTNTVGWVYSLPFYFGAGWPGPLDALDLTAFGVYALGTILHGGSDYQKQRFKARPESRGKLLDTGFWALCRHPNYFGDFLIYVAFALIGHSLWGGIAPLANLLQYLFDAIPKNERWAAERYGAAWEAYARRTKKFIPYIY